MAGLLQEGKVTSFTGGYVMDNRVGNTGVQIEGMQLPECAEEMHRARCSGDVSLPMAPTRLLGGTHTTRVCPAQRDRTLQSAHAADGLGAAFGILSA